MSGFLGLFGEKKEKAKKATASSKDHQEKQEEKNKKDDIPAGFGGSKKAASWLKDEAKDSKPAPTDSKAKDVAKTEPGKAEKSSQASTMDKKDDKKSVSIQDEPALKQKVDTKRPKDPTKPIIVSFVSKGKKIANDFVFTDKLGTHLKTTDLPDIPGYRLQLKGNFDYQIKIVEQKVTLHYVKDKVKYTLVPVTEDGKVIDKAKSRHFDGEAGDKISKDKYPVVKGYAPHSSRKYEVPKESGEVKIYYTAKTQTYHVFYKTKSGEVLGNDTKHGKTGERYSVNPERRTFSGYQLAELPKNQSGVIPPNSFDVNIMLEPVKSKIVVVFQDISGNQIHAPMEYEKRYKDPYNIKLPVTDGYELVSNPNLLNGFYEKDTKKIVLQYKRATVSFKINRWFDKEFKHSAGDAINVSGPVGSPYKRQIPQIDGFTANKDYVEGKFDAFENPDVDVIYSKIECEAHILLVDEADRPLPGVKQIVKKGLWADSIDVELPEVPGFKRPMKVLKKKFNRAHQSEVVHYSAEEVMLTVNYIDSRTNKAIAGYPADKRPGLSGTTYNVEGEMIDGYRLIKLPDNAKGVYTAKPINVDLMYEPNPSSIVIHRIDETLQDIRKTEVRPGYYGQKYKVNTDDVPGYKFVSASTSLEGTFPASRLDIYLNFESADVKFTLTPVDQFGREIDKKLNIEITGKAGQEFSHVMPEIPGYDASATEISGKIKADYQGKTINVPYSPKTEIITVHTIYAGGDKDGLHPFSDVTQPGPMGTKFEYVVPELPGYEPSTHKLSAVFTAEPQELTVVYSVKKEEYLVHYVDENGQMVGGMPKGEGFYNQAIDVSKNVPRGFGLPDGVDKYIYLDGSNDYRVLVNAVPLTVEIVAQAKDSEGKVVDLDSRMQKDGHYHEEKTFEAMSVPGYKPVNGNEIKVKFELGQTRIPVMYEAEEKTLAISFINASTGQKISFTDPETGKTINGTKTVKGKFNEEYDEYAPKIPGFVAINRTHESGTFGLQNIEMAFLYTAASDTLNRAITNIDDIINDNTAHGKPNAQTVVSPSSSPVVETPPYDLNDQIPSAKLNNSASAVDNGIANDGTNGDSMPEGAVNLIDKLQNQNQQ